MRGGLGGGSRKSALEFLHVILCVVQARQTLWRGDEGGKMSLDGTESEEKKREETQLFPCFVFLRVFVRAGKTFLPGEEGKRKMDFV